MCEYVKQKQAKIMVVCTMIYVPLFLGHCQNTGHTNCLHNLRRLVVEQNIYNTFHNSEEFAIEKSTFVRFFQYNQLMAGNCLHYYMMLEDLTTNNVFSKITLNNIWF